jgi:Uncharacterised protein family (UPF0158)
MALPDEDVLIEALTSVLDDIHYYYDRQTGEVIALSEEFGTGEIEGPASRYQPITPLSVSERYQIMEDFVETLGNQSLQDELTEALIEMGAFQKFEVVLKKYPTRYRQWEVFRTDKVKSRARAWLRENKVG